MQNHLFGRKLHLLMNGLKQIHVYVTLECTHSCHMHPRSKYMSRNCCIHLKAIAYFKPLCKGYLEINLLRTYRILYYL